MTDNKHRYPPTVAPTPQTRERELITRIEDAVAKLEGRMDACEQRQARESKALARFDGQSLN
jgi:hypothetical protein